METDSRKCDTAANRLITKTFIGQLFACDIRCDSHHHRQIQNNNIWSVFFFGFIGLERASRPMIGSHRYKYKLTQATKKNQNLKDTSYLQCYISNF